MVFVCYNADKDTMFSLIVVGSIPANVSRKQALTDVTIHIAAPAGYLYIFRIRIV